MIMPRHSRPRPTAAAIAGNAMVILALLHGGCSLLPGKQNTASSTPAAAQTVATEESSQPAPAKTAQDIYHTIRAGESLSRIAAWYTGSIDNWRRIANANSDLNPDLLKPGQQIRIPAEIIATRKTMPVDYRLEIERDTKAGKPAAEAQRESHSASEAQTEDRQGASDAEAPVLPDMLEPKGL